MNASKLKAACPAACLLLAGACADASPGLSFAEELDIDLARMERQVSGLYVEDVEVGSGPVAEVGQLVTVHYTGWLPDGTEFDSSRGSEAPFEVVIGEGAVIDGWDQGIPGMRVGGRRKLVIPPELAYGVQGRGGVIPPNATLVFEVEMLGARDVASLPPAR